MPKSESEQPSNNALPPAPPLSPPAFMKSEAEDVEAKEEPVAKVEQSPKVEEEKELLSEDDEKALMNVEEESKTEVSPSVKVAEKKKGEAEFYMDAASIASDKDLHKKVVRVREELEAELLKRLKMQASLFRKIEKSFHLCFFDE